MSERASTYDNIHARAATGIDAYEAALDFLAANRWPALRFNLLWLFGSALLWLAGKSLLFNGSTGISTLIVSFLLPWLYIVPVWETANISKFRYNRRISLAAVITVCIERTLLYAVLVVTYLPFVLSGIYIHSRLLLHTADIGRTGGVVPLHGLIHSWRLTKGHGLSLYSLWIVTVISKPICALPLGLGFVLERPLSGFAKDILMTTLCADQEMPPA